MSFAQQNLQAAIQRLNMLKKAECFDAVNLDSRPTPAQLDILQSIDKYQYRIVRAGNQAGKSSVGARELTWVLEGTHPYWKRPERWGNEPLLCIIAGIDRKQMELELWNKKIKPLFQRPEEWREVRSGNALQHCKNKVTGDTIVFLSHSDSSETNRKHMQGYVGHWLWLDEMPTDIRIIEELQRRVDARRGYMLATFTPKVRSEPVKQFLDAIEPPLGKTFSITKLDNPLYADRREEELQKLKGLPEHMVNTILYGAWMAGEQAVYDFDPTTMVERPEDYSPAWRHVEASDPAVSSKFGLTIWAEKPETGVWYCVKADYIKDIASPDDIVKEVIKKTEKYNIIRRVVDPHETWYIGMASKMKLTYMSPYDKNNRKDELVKGLQLALSDGRIKIAPWCVDLISELQTAEWKESENGKAKVKGSKYMHLSDSAQYFVDCMPKPEIVYQQQSWQEKLRSDNKERKRIQALGAKARVGRKKWVVGPGGIRRL